MFKTKFCQECGGVKSVKKIVRIRPDEFKDVTILPKDWMKHGFACDVGCICK